VCPEITHTLMCRFVPPCKENRSVVSESGLLWRIFGPKTDVKDYWKTLRGNELCNLYLS
jgi:hypothetical protein